ncbi:DUF3021 domain-containing protein [Salinicoccus cyprini]|uniref:DUF3021 domain-containing protein n=1 Tax=Salinicoccus cyprini TaxID=2493691 RepID=A0A558AYR3_9STAP|nr:DUF3021 family protein [Salinicoccus cyprini]TVT29387.1 DUF3021 domain-containing protein [Salinicoccus cyprini]
MHLVKKGLTRGTMLLLFMMVLLLLSYTNGASDEAIAYVFYGIIAFFLGVTSVIYLVGEWSFGKQIIVHYISMLLIVFPTLLLSGFYHTESFSDILQVFILFNKAGIILFFVTFFASKLIRTDRTKREV